jgi:hypothetical protein
MIGAEGIPETGVPFLSPDDRRMLWWGKHSAGGLGILIIQE